MKWPAKGEFRISRSVLTEFITVQVQITQDGYSGRAECRPYARYEETAESVIAQIKSVKSHIEDGIPKEQLQHLLDPGAARNALDCALWDLEAKKADKRIWELADISEPHHRETAFTLSLNEPAIMAAASLNATDHKVLKMKIGDFGGLEAVRAVLQARPDARLIIDANEAMSPEDFEKFQSLDQVDRIALIEQPFPSHLDRKGMFDPHSSPIICADESLHTSEDLEKLWQIGYRAINVKLDKTGGFTEALALLRKAKEMGFKMMAGCMVGSSLAMAPMVILESFADYIDLDGPLLLNDDFSPPLKYKGGNVFPPSKDLWG